MIDFFVRPDIGDILLICFGLVCAGIGAAAGAITTTNKNQRFIMDTMQEVIGKLETAAGRIETLTGQVTELSGVIVKVGNETDGVKEALRLVQEELANLGTPSPALQAAVANLEAKIEVQATSIATARTNATVVDDKVADAVVEPPPVEPPVEPPTEPPIL